MAIDEQLRNEAEAWLAEDPDPGTQRELQDLLERRDEETLRQCFSGPLEFGTAGLRGLLGPGPSRMNRAVVQRATAGLCRYVLEHVPKAAERGICIGYDGRRMSERFAEDAAEIACGAGMKARIFDHVVPTPLLAFAALDRGAAAAVIVTASHNPPAYNGYKVYWENGAQIVPPHDEGIAKRIAQVGALSDLPRVSRDDAAASGQLEVLGEDVVRRYLDGVRALARQPGTPRTVSMAHTSLHGVGAPYVRAALKEAGFAQVHEVAEQADPDGAFPTVEFPNPEEPGAMDRVLELARAHETDLVLANDPDADRLAVAVRDGAEYRMLSGNELGCLLGHYVLKQDTAEAAPGRGTPLVINTIVSSPMLGVIAEHHGARWERTLTGFKWIANRAMELEREQGLRFVFGYEEALGYTVGTLVRDKDGISTAAMIADMAAWCRTQDRTLLDELERCWRRYGMHLSRQISITHEGARGAARIGELMAAARAQPPTRLDDRAVVAVEDLQAGTRTPREGAPETLPFPPADVVVFELEGGHRAMLRPSGTEPKIKYYVDVRVDPAEGEPIEEARQRGQTVLDGIAESLRAQVE